MLRVRFTRWLAFSFLIAGGALTLVSLLIAAIGPPETAIIGLGGIVSMFFGWAYLGRVVYFVVTGSELVIPMQRGPARRTALGGGRLHVEGNRLVIARQGQRAKKLPVYRFYAHPEDWAKAVAAISYGGQRR